MLRGLIFWFLSYQVEKEDGTLEAQELSLEVLQALSGEYLNQISSLATPYTLEEADNVDMKPEMSAPETELDASTSANAIKVEISTMPPHQNSPSKNDGEKQADKEPLFLESSSQDNSKEDDDDEKDDVDDSSKEEEKKRKYYLKNQSGEKEKVTLKYYLWSIYLHFNFCF